VLPKGKMPQRLLKENKPHRYAMEVRPFTQKRGQNFLLSDVEALGSY
jgi:hypothetical protein